MTELNPPPKVNYDDSFDKTQYGDDLFRQCLEVAREQDTSPIHMAAVILEFPMPTKSAHKTTAVAAKVMALQAIACMVIEDKGIAQYNADVLRSSVNRVRAGVPIKQIMDELTEVRVRRGNG